jgi:hypothetical protein
MVLTAVVLALALSGGCAASAPPPTVAVRDAPADPPRFTLARPGESGLVPAAKWPKACDLITDSDVRAILPQASGIDHAGRQATVDVADHIGVTRQRQLKVPQPGCRIEFVLPSATADDARLASTSVQIDLVAVGTKKVAKLNYNEFGDVVEVSDADSCRGLAASTYTCRVEGVVFTLSGDTASDLQFEGQRGEAPDFYRRHVVPEFVRLVAAKL